MQEEKELSVSQSSDIPEWIKIILKIAEDAKKNSLKKYDTN